MHLIQSIPQLGVWAQHHVSLIIGGFAGLLVLMAVVSLLTRGRQPAQTTHGSARFATARELQQAGLSTQHGVVIGEVKR